MSKSQRCASVGITLRLRGNRRKVHPDASHAPTTCIRTMHVYTITTVVVVVVGRGLPTFRSKPRYKRLFNVFVFNIRRLYGKSQPGKYESHNFTRLPPGILTLKKRSIGPTRTLADLLSDRTGGLTTILSDRRARENRYRYRSVLGDQRYTVYGSLRFAKLVFFFFFFSFELYFRKFAFDLKIVSNGENLDI